MPNSLLEALKLGIWDYEPEPDKATQYEATEALPGSTEKLDVLAARLAKGMPLWHPADRLVFKDDERD